MSMLITPVLIFCCTFPNPSDTASCTELFFSDLPLSKMFICGLFAKCVSVVWIDVGKYCQSLQGTCLSMVSFGGNKPPKLHSPVPLPLHT